MSLELKSQKTSKFRQNLRNERNDSLEKRIVSKIKTLSVVISNLCFTPDIEQKKLLGLILKLIMCNFCKLFVFIFHCFISCFHCSFEGNFYSWYYFQLAPHSEVLRLLKERCLLEKTRYTTINIHRLLKGSAFSKRGLCY